MKLFPHALMRVAAGPYDDLESLAAPQTLAAAGAILDLEAQLGALRDPLCDALFDAVRTTDDAASSRKVLNLKRDIFNGRRLRPAQTEKAWPYLDAGTRAQLNRYLELENQLAAAEARGEGIFEDELDAARDRLKALTRMDALRKGLVLSSQTLLKGLDSYVARPNRTLRKQELKAELSLLQYLTRVCGKTSPFSTFTNLAIAGFDAASDEDLLVAGARAMPVVGFIRLNNTLFKYLQDLLKEMPDYYRNFPVRPNPTLKRDGEYYLYLTNSNNVESFQRIPLNPVLDLFWDLCAAEKGGVVFKTLVEQAGEMIDADAEGLSQYINQLLKFGFLEFNLGISGIDTDWDLKLRDFLGGLSPELPFISQLIEALTFLREQADIYAQSSAEQRIDILTLAFERFRTVCMLLHEAAGLPETERMTPEEFAAHHRREEAEKAKEKNAKAKRDAKSEGDGQTESTDKGNQGDHKGQKDHKNQENQEGQEDQEDRQDQEKAEGDQPFVHKSWTHFSFKPEQMFYEDCVLDLPMNLAGADLPGLFEKLDRLYREPVARTGTRADLDAMTHYFTNRYAGDVDLLSFYEAYYREYKKPEAEQQNRAKKEARKAAQAKVEAAQAGAAEKGADVGTAAAKDNRPDAEQDESKKQPEIPEIPQDMKKIPIMETRRDQLNQFNEALRAQLQRPPTSFPASEPVQVDLNLDMVTRAHGDWRLDEGESGSAGSQSVFIQLFRERDETGAARTLGVINANPIGYGKFFSRFLHIFDESVTRDLRQWNSAIDPDALLLEDCDASMFNANLHPPLMPFEVWMPGGQNSLPPDRQIPITDFRIRAGDHGLDLIHQPSGKPAYIFDLGFQGSMGRSELFRLLLNFSPARYHTYWNLVQAVNDPEGKGDKPASAQAAPSEKAASPDGGERVATAKGEEKASAAKGEVGDGAEPEMLGAGTPGAGTPGAGTPAAGMPAAGMPAADASASDAQPAEPEVAYAPRLVYENQLVIQRRAWRFPKAKLPQREHQESNWSYFLRLQRWKRAYGMPDQVFVVIVGHGETERLAPKLMEQLRRDDYKPQYIDFNSPLVIRLLEKLIARAPNHLTVREMLPAPGQLARLNDARYITEAVIQWESD